MNRRGNVLDSLLIILVMVALAITGLLMVGFANIISDAFNQSNSIPTDAKELSNSVNQQTPGIIDFAFAMLFIGLPLLGMALAFFVDTHPIIFWASLGLVLLLVILAAGFSVAWEALTQEGFLSEAAHKLPITNFIMNNFGVYAFLVFCIMAFGTFVKSRSGGYYE
jgi:hypothetical protein